MVKPEHGIAIDAMLKGAEATLTDECCIYRVPFKIRRHNVDAYTPMVVSIGPFHHNTLPRLHNMERHKLYYCKAFLQRTHATSRTWIRYIESVEPKFRRCYSETLPFSKEQLMKIIFVDSGFILELFYRYYDRYNGNGWSSYDACLLTPEMSVSIRQDMLLLENQIPSFVLEDLFDMSTPAQAHNSNIPSFIQLTFGYFNCYNSSNVSYNNINTIRHFTDLLRMLCPPPPPPPNIDVDEPKTQLCSATEFSVCFNAQSVMRVLDRVKHGFRWMKMTKHTESCHSENRSEPDTETYVHLPSATELSEAGVKFKVNNSKDKCLLDLKFNNPVLRIPQLLVDDATETLFRNMVALEQCHYPNESYITKYVSVMDFLINTSGDVDLLVRKGILINWLGDNASVANLFNNLCNNIIMDTVGYEHVYRDLNAFRRNRWNNLKSTLRHDYCKTPWQTAATVAAILLLILSLGQTVCSVLQVILQ